MQSLACSRIVGQRSPFGFEAPHCWHTQQELRGFLADQKDAALHYACGAWEGLCYLALALFHAEKEVVWKQHGCYSDLYTDKGSISQS